MNDASHQKEPPEQAPQADAAAAPSSVQQRRRLLRSLGAGGAIMGVGLPFKAQAAGRPHCVKDLKNYHATASAVGSMVGSVAGTVPPKAGYNCAHYRVSGNWYTGWTNGGTTPVALTWTNCGSTTSTTKLRFWQCFELSDPGALSTAAINRTCTDILNLYPTSDEAHWLVALFNANKCGTNFTYTPAQVLSLYKGVNPMTGWNTADIKVKALSLFRDYLSQMS